jgi:hypothetical protein
VLPEVVIEVVAEGGSLAILRERIAEGWQFRVELDETTLYDMLSEEDRPGMEVADFALTEYAQTFKERCVESIDTSGIVCILSRSIQISLTRFWLK